MGVKGPSLLFKLIPNLPSTAPDVMHQVYIGLTKVLLRVISDKSLKVDLERLKFSVNKLRLPSEFERNIRPLDQLEFFKANELRPGCFVGPALFSGCINERIREVFTLQFWYSVADGITKVCQGGQKTYRRTSNFNRKWLHRICRAFHQLLIC